MSRSTQRAVVRVSYSELGRALGLAPDLRIVGILPDDPIHWRSEAGQLLLEGPSCPEVVEGALYPHMRLVVHMVDGHPETRLECT